MPAYLLTWNPKNSDWEDDFEEAYVSIQKGYAIEQGWSCRINFRKMKEGDDVWLMRQGKEPKGIFAHGIITEAPYLGCRYFDGKPGYFVDFDMDWLVNPETERDQMFLRDRLKSDHKRVNWDTQSSGIFIPDEVADSLSEEFEE